MFTIAFRTSTRTIPKATTKAAITNVVTRRVTPLTFSHLRNQRAATMTTHEGTTLTLNTGAKLPAMGFGTWQDKDAQEKAVVEALKAGYRHIDTAAV